MDYESTPIPSAIESAESSSAQTLSKCLVDGQLVIRKNGRKYNAVGIEIK